MRAHALWNRQRWCRSRRVRNWTLSHNGVESLPHGSRATLLARAHILQHTRGRLIPGAAGVRTVVTGVDVERRGPGGGRCVLERHRAVGPRTNQYVFDLDWSPDGQIGSGD
jgi:hypothetical protein